jgi:RNA-binding protein
VKLTSAQRKHLESLAIHLEPSVQIGKQGLESNIALRLKESFYKHELVKIKILDTAPVETDEVAEMAVKAAKATLVRVIGRTVVLYKPFKDKPRKIELPKA